MAALPEGIDKNLFKMPENQFQIDAKIITPEGRSSIKRSEKLVIETDEKGQPVFLKDSEGQPLKDKEGKIIYKTKRVVELEQLPIKEMHLSDFITSNLNENDELDVRDLLFAARSCQATMYETGVDLRPTIEFNLDLALILANTSKGRNGRVLDAMREHRLIEHSNEVTELKNMPEQDKKLFGIIPQR